MPLISGGGGSFNGGTITPTDDPGLAIRVPETTSEALTVVDATSGSTTFAVDPFGDVSTGAFIATADNTAAGGTLAQFQGATAAEAFFDYFQVRGAGPVYFLRIIASGGVLLPSLPTADPHVAGQLYSLAGTLHVSAG